MISIFEHGDVSLILRNRIPDVVDHRLHMAEIGSYHGNVIPYNVHALLRDVLMILDHAPRLAAILLDRFEGGGIVVERRRVVAYQLGQDRIRLLLGLVRIDTRVEICEDPFVLRRHDKYNQRQAHPREEIRGVMKKFGPFKCLIHSFTPFPWENIRDCSP